MDGLNTRDIDFEDVYDRFGRPTGRTMGIPAGMTGGVPMGSNMGLPTGRTMGIPTGMTGGVPMGSNMGLPTGRTMGIPPGMTTELPNERTLGTPANGLGDGYYDPNDGYDEFIKNYIPPVNLAIAVEDSARVQTGKFPALFNTVKDIVSQITAKFKTRVNVLPFAADGNDVPSQLTEEWTKPANNDVAVNAFKKWLTESPPGPAQDGLKFPQLFDAITELANLPPPPESTFKADGWTQKIATILLVVSSGVVRKEDRYLRVPEDVNSSYIAKAQKRILKRGWSIFLGRPLPTVINDNESGEENQQLDNTLITGGQTPPPSEILRVYYAADDGNFAGGTDGLVNGIFRDALFQAPPPKREIIKPKPTPPGPTPVPVPPYPIDEWWWWIYIDPNTGKFDWRRVPWINGDDCCNIPPWVYHLRLPPIERPPGVLPQTWKEILAGKCGHGHHGRKGRRHHKPPAPAPTPARRAPPSPAYHRPVPSPAPAHHRRVVPSPAHHYRRRQQHGPGGRRMYY